MRLCILKPLGEVNAHSRTCPDSAARQDLRLFKHSYLNIVEFIPIAKRIGIYIHQNPCEIGLVDKPEDWEFLSYRDYLGIRNDTLVNIQLAEQIIEFDKGNFAEWSKAVLDEKMLKAIW